MPVSAISFFTVFNRAFTLIFRVGVQFRLTGWFGHGVIRTSPLGLTRLVRG